MNGEQRPRETLFAQLSKLYSESVWESAMVNWFKMMVKPGDGFVGSCFVRHNSTTFDTRRCFVSIKNGYRETRISIFISLRARNERRKVQKWIPVSFLNYDCSFHVNYVLVPARRKKLVKIARISRIEQSVNGHHPDDRRSFINSQPNIKLFLKFFFVSTFTMRGTS